MDRPLLLRAVRVPDVPPAAAAAAARPSTRSGWPAVELLRLAGAAAAGGALYGAFPPVGAAVLAPLGVALLVLATRGTTARRGGLLGLVAGLAFFLPLLSWTGLQVGPLPWALLSLAQAAFFAGLGAALAPLQRLPLAPVWIVGAWLAQEALRSRLPFGGFPWGRLGFSQVGSPLLRVAALGGAPLVSAAVALLGAVLAGLVGSVLVAPARPDRLALLRTAGGAVLAVAIVALACVLAPVGGTGPTAQVAVVQGNVPRLGLAFDAQRAAVLGNHVAATHQLAGDVRAGRLPRPDLVVWPENASDLDPFSESDAYRAIDDAVRDIGVPVLVGALVDGPGDKISNTGVVWDPRTGPGESYVKRHPVPFGEYIPLRPIARLVSHSVDLVARDFAAGTRVGRLDVGPATVGDVICFEVAYDGLVRDTVRAGATMIVVQTNNATFERSAETEQQLAMSRLRAVEAGRSVVVAATSGVSAVVRPDGSLAHRSAVFTRDISVTAVPLRTAQTPATRLGAVPEAALSALAGVGLLLSWRSRRAR